MFKSKLNEESDNEFYENLKHLNEERNYARRDSNATINETISIKEENFLNKDILNLINSPNVTHLIILESKKTVKFILKLL